MEKDIKKIRDDFPILQQKVNGKELVYLDNAATTHKPLKVIKAIEDYYKKLNANVHRGAHYLSIVATEAYDKSRETVKSFINAEYMEEVIFTKNATESLNLLAYSYGMTFLEEGNEILIAISEHHSNLIPWQRVAKAKGAILKYVYVNSEGRLDLEEVRSKINDNTKIVSIAQMSNALGTIHPIKEISEIAHKYGAVMIVDGSQSVPHMKVDVRDLNADFLVFSGHKLMAPMGIGVLYGKRELLDKMPPFLYGGDMIEYVEEQDSTFAELPYKLEAGTQNVEGAVGLAAAIEYIEEIGFSYIIDREEELTCYALEGLKELSYVKIIGPTDMKDRGAVISFNIEGVHPHDVSSIMDSYGVAVRAGHHCAQPLMKYLGINSTARASFYFYNTKEEIDVFVDNLKNVRKWLGYGS
ncbi:cysteine desulfurase [Hathewaya histolytica]|uniref:cysteine desulfurase n=1 Tax=Hathewaya histolytica TaxID=1498 RepID=A0A4U9RTL8_HATHI|nr:cysteine desulfurase [Hathewaya histolytica]VTQ95722.1 cysteine desulfurase-like protein, SufS subfamily [Hathewaya histolytica]